MGAMHSPPADPYVHNVRRRPDPNRPPRRLDPVPVAALEGWRATNYPPAGWYGDPINGAGVPALVGREPVDGTRGVHARSPLHRQTSDFWMYTSTIESPSHQLQPPGGHRNS